MSKNLVLPRRTALKGGPYPLYLKPGELFVVLGDTATAMLIGDEFGKPVVAINAGYDIPITPNLTQAWLNGSGTILFANTAPTTVAQFMDTQPFQKFTVQSRNGNTSIAHNANIRLKGAATLPLTLDSVIAFQADETGLIVKQI